MDVSLKENPFIAAPRKACDGRCHNACSKRVPRCLVFAACSGLVGGLQKQGSELVAWPISHQENKVHASLEEFNVSLQKACDQQAFDQLVLIGSQNDIAWVRASLPLEAQGKLVAEIVYPLMLEWLQEPTLVQLIAAVTPLIQ